MNTTTLYVPPGCKTLDQIGDSQIRLGLQGPPFSGKTTASLTFPNPVILSYDRKVSAHKHRTDVLLVPFHDSEFVTKIVPRAGTQAPVNRKDALLKWLDRDGTKLSTEQTLILDGCSAIEESYHIWYKANEYELAMTKKGGVDSFVEWSLKKSYFEELHMALKAVPCNVIFICHETPDRDKQGELNGKIRPLLTGQAGDKLGGNLTDFFRAHAVEKPKEEKRILDFKKKFRCSEEAYKEWMSTGTDDTLFLWQVQEDETCDCGTSSLQKCPKYILPTYETFQKYRR